jgi:hypothetical protein
LAERRIETTESIKPNNWNKDMKKQKRQKHLFRWPAANSGARLAILGLALAIATPIIAADTQAVPNEHADSIAKNLHAEAGELLDVRLGDLHPTQAVLGYYEVFYKLGRYQAGKDAVNKRFDDWGEANGQTQAKPPVSPDAQLSDQPPCECAVALGQETEDSIAPMKTAVIGLGGRLYLVDGHHTPRPSWKTPTAAPTCICGCAFLPI